MISRSKDLSRMGAFAVVGLLTLIYGITDYKMANEGGFPAPYGAVQPITESSSGMTSGTDVPTDVETQIMSSLQDLSGLDEVVVLPAQQESGYQVSATINLGYDNNFDPGQARPTITQLTDQFYRALYTSGQQVEDAQLFFMSNGVTVAGSGLGLQAYKRLSQLALSDGASDLVSSITAGSQGASSSPSEAWFEIEQKVAP